MMNQDIASPEKKKKKGILSPLKDRMGLGQTTEFVSNNPTPPAGLGMFPNSVDMALQDKESDSVGDKIRTRMKDRKGG